MQKSNAIWDYLTTISHYQKTNENNAGVQKDKVQWQEETYLSSILQKIDINNENSVLHSYLFRKIPKQDIADNTQLIFPFGFNLSQKEAVAKALISPISIIEGPPGTGKTQTILNIIANLVAVQGKTVAVVSNNNAAISNVKEKLDTTGCGFIMAMLGSKENQEKFFEKMPEPYTDGWDCDVDAAWVEIKKMNVSMDAILTAEKEKAELTQELEAWKLEQKHFEQYYKQVRTDHDIEIKKFFKNADYIIQFLVRMEILNDYHQIKNVFGKIAWFFKNINLFIRYGINNCILWLKHQKEVVLELERQIYYQQIVEIQNQIADRERILHNFSFDKMKIKHQELSNKIYHKALYDIYKDLGKNEFRKDNYKNKYHEFVKRFPVTGSTTYAIWYSKKETELFDYVIIDEASQVDLVTGVNALACCKNVVIVGDEKQLPQIVNSEIRKYISEEYISEKYDYFKESILTSVKKLYGSTIPRTLLREHYRCHPEIIGFCNQRYYNRQLIIYTDPEMSNTPLILARLTEGNHMREDEKKKIYSQRELSVTNEIMEKYNLTDREDIGFVTPYRKQADKAEERFGNILESDTVHKYQGREKDIMIMSTVLDSKSQGNKRQMGFVDDPHMVNVAVSRAKRQFILVTDHDLFFDYGKEINALIRYIRYHTPEKNIVQSQIVSVFDLLYKKYSPKLLAIKHRVKVDAENPSEAIMAALLDEMFSEPDLDVYSYEQQIKLFNILVNTSDLLPEELQYVLNGASVDFVIYNKMDKQIKLIIEVDGYTYHEKNPEQQKRDVMKDRILERYNLKPLRLKTNGDSEEKQIRERLEKS